MKTACAYLRTSSATNVGADKDSHKRQLAAIEAYARDRFQIVHTYYDEAVSGADPIHERPGFADMLAYIASNGCRTILVESAHRFARDLIAAETGFAMLRQQGIELIAVDSPQAFIEDTPTARLIRQILAAVSEYEKAALVAKLAGARRRIRASGRKCEGRRNHAQIDPQTTAMANELRGQGLSYRAISAQLATMGHLNANGRPYAPASIASMTKDRQ